MEEHSVSKWEVLKQAGNPFEFLFTWLMTPVDSKVLG